MGLDLIYIEGQTPLDEEEKEGLLISTIATKAELDEFEQQNIEDAIQWTLGKRVKITSLCTEVFVKDVNNGSYESLLLFARS